jgi:hypothetical protein
MRRRSSTHDSRQTTIFDVLAKRHIEATAIATGSDQDIDQRFRAAVSEALKRCPLSRYEVAARMSELTGTDITKTMLDSWTAESKEGHRFPAVYLPAFCKAVSNTEPLTILGVTAGVFVMPGRDALRAEIQQLEEEINRAQTERRKRLTFLKEMES